MDDNSRRQRFSATFSPVSNTGVVLWMQLHQILILGALVTYFLMVILFHAPLFTGFHMILFAIGLFAAVSYKGRSLLQIVGVYVGFGLRSATGQTRWTFNPLSANTTVGYIDLPGAAGKRLKPLEVVNTQFAGACFLYDRENGHATAVLRCMGKPFVFTKQQTQDDRAAAFSSLLASLAEVEDIVRITVQARSMITPFTIDAAQEEARFAVREQRDMIAQQMKTLTSHDMIITLTVNPERARGIVKNYGGGIAGISGLLKDRLIPLVTRLDNAGIDTSMNIVWENLPQLRGLMKLMTSSDTLSVINSKHELDDTVPVASNYREYNDYMHVGDTYARTLWVDKWPSDPASVGFLHSLIASKTTQIIFTQTFAPLAENKARKRLNERKNEIERITRLNKNMGRNDDPRLTLEKNEVDKRLTELADNKAEVAFQGFVTILAATKDDLDEDTRNVIVSNKYMHFDRMHGQQYVGWIAAQPLGQAGR